MNKKGDLESSSKEIHNQVVKFIEREKIFLLLTANSLERVFKWADYALGNGFHLVGVDFRISGIKDCLKSFKKKGERSFGVFSITTVKEARLAINCGAIFIFSSNSDKRIIRKCQREKIFHAMGSLTPTEAFHTFDLGADSVSLYPCGAMGGLGWFLFMKEVFPKVKLIPTDMMTPFEVSQYLGAGAYAAALIMDLEKVNEPDKFINELNMLLA